MKAVMPPRLFPGGGGRLGHDDDDAGLYAIGAPEFLAVEDDSACRPRGLGVRLHLRGVGADLRLGEREGGDFAAGDARQETALLLLCAEEDERLRHADGLMRGEERGEVAAIAAEQHAGAAVIGLREAEAAVFGRDLDAEGAELREAGDDFIAGFRRCGRSRRDRRARRGNCAAARGRRRPGRGPRPAGAGKGRIWSIWQRPMKRPPTKPRSACAASRAPSLSSSAARWPADIFEVSITVSVSRVGIESPVGLGHFLKQLAWGEMRAGSGGLLAQRRGDRRPLRAYRRSAAARRGMARSRRP